MTLDEVLELARFQVSGEAPADSHVEQLLRADKLARFVLDTLGQQMPCGFDEPRVTADAPNVYRYVAWNDAEYSPDEAVALGAALIRAGLSARQGGG